MAFKRTGPQGWGRLYVVWALTAGLGVSGTFDIHNDHRVPEGIAVKNFQPPSEYETYGVEGLVHALSTQEGVSHARIAQAFLSERVGLEASEFIERASTSSDVSSIVYYNQQLNGIKVANSVAHVAINKANNMIASFSRTLFRRKPESVAPSEPNISLDDAKAIAAEAFDGSANEVSSLEYFIQESGEAILTHVVQIIGPHFSFYEVFVDAHDGTIVNYHDFVAHATYRVVPIGKQDPTTGFELVSSPEINDASPLGWVAKDATQGNNAIGFLFGLTDIIALMDSQAFKGVESATAIETALGIFDYLNIWTNTTQPLDPAASAASKVNAFYIVNSIHDIAYLYGFNEQAFNFQKDNGGKGGVGGDPVLVSVQNTTYVNNAAIATTPEGQSPLLVLWLFNTTKPGRDPAFSNDVVTHEFTHGITNRLTSGGTNRCLQATEARALGEGWSDAMADWVQVTELPIRDFTSGNWILGQRANGTGVRAYPYSTDKKINPLTYKSWQATEREHGNGEIWANILHNIHATLLETNGFSPNAKTDSSGKAGNVVFMYLFIDQLQLQPCNPGFVTARDSWIQADANRYAGAHRCILWKVFASRGLGVNAKPLGADSTAVDDFTIPDDCRTPA